MMDPSGGNRNVMPNDTGLYNQQTAMASSGMYNPMMMGGYNSSSGSVEGLTVQCDMVNSQVNVLPPMGTFIGQTNYSNCLTMQGQQSPHLTRLGMQNLSPYPNMAQNVCVPSNNTLPSFGHCFLTPSFNQQQALFAGNANQGDRVSSGFHVISNQMPGMGVTVSSATNPMHTSNAPIINSSAFIPKTSVYENVCAPFSSSERLLSQHADVFNVISSIPQKIILQQHKSQELVEENVVSSTHESVTSPVAHALPAGDAVPQNQIDVNKVLHHSNVNVKQNKGEILVPKQVTMGSVDPPKKESTSVPKSESPKFMKEETLSQIIVPLGWSREKKDGAIVYYSPSNVPLCSIEEVNQYLLSDSTCKCGLECPVVVSKTFNFDVSVESTKWSLELTKSSEDLTNLCNHRRKIINMATFQSSALTVTEEPGGGVVASSKSTDKSKTKKKRSRAGSYSSPYDRVRVADLIAERDRLRLEEETLARQASKDHMDKPVMSSVEIQSSTDHVKTPPSSAPRTGLMSPPLPPPSVVQPLLQTVSEAPHVYTQQFSSMHSAGMIPSSYPQNIADAINAARNSHVGLTAQSQTFFPTDSVHPHQAVNLPPLGSPTMGPQSFSLFPQTGGFGVPPGYLEKRGNSSYPMPYTKPSMYRFTNPALSDLIDPISWSEKKKPKSKKPRAKKEKKKTISVFESDTPPPNVDVSVLKDHGHGPIPKVKCSTPSSQFVENATGYLADQALMIKSSLASGSQDSKENPSTSQVTYSLPTSSSYGTANDNLDISTNVVVHTSQPDRPDLSISISDTTMRALSMSDNTFTEDRCHSLSPSDSNGECPAETMMPTSIVHHTGKPEVPKVEIKVSDSIKLTDVAHVATIPMQTLNTVNSKQSDGAVLPNFSTIQQLLGYNMSNQFPASKMLSAAARAQMAQKTTVEPTELSNVQVTQQLLTSFQKNFLDKSGSNVGIIANEQDALKFLGQKATLVSSSASGILPASQQSGSNSSGLKISTSTAPTFSINSQIPSVLLQSGSQQQIGTEVSNVLTVLNNSQQMSQILSSSGAPLLSTATPTAPVMTTQLISQQPAVASSQSAHISGSQANLIQTQSAQIATTQQAPIIYTQATSILSTQTTPIMHTQATPIINTQATPIMNTQNSQFLSAVGNINQNAVMFSNPALNCAQNSSMFNQVMNPSSLMVPGNLAYAPDQCMPGNFNLGGVGNQQIVGNNSNVCIKPLGQFINMDANQIKQGLPPHSCDLAQSNLQSGIPNPTGQLLVLPNLQMPLVQVFNNGQKNGAPDINSLLSQLQTNIAPMLNAQQVWNNLTTGSNLTAMQLQTLQLQQQLLQQIQQLQGMQSLINQFSAGDINKVPAQFSMEMDRKDSNALSMVTMVNDVSTTTESPPLQNQENDEESSMELSSEVTSTHAGNTDSEIADSTREEDSKNLTIENGRTEDEMDVDAEIPTERESEDEQVMSNDLEVNEEMRSYNSQHSNEEQENCCVSQGPVHDYDGENLSQECSEDDTRINSSTQTKVEKDCDTSTDTKCHDKEEAQSDKKATTEEECLHLKICDGDSESKISSLQKGITIRRDDSVCVPDSSQSKEISGSPICDVPVVTSSTKHSNNTTELGTKSLTEDFTADSSVVKGVNGGVTFIEADSSVVKGVNGGVTFIEGDLIWGQIRGFPSWPGKVVPPCEVIDPEPLEMGKIWVKWYGDHTFTQVEQDKLKSLVDGLKAHQRQRNRKGRKMNSNLEAAIQEALADLGQITTSNINSKGKSSKKKRVR